MLTSTLINELDMQSSNIENLDKELDELRKQKPDTTFSEYYASLVLKKIEQGEAHATLGPNLRDHEDWWNAGKKRFAQYQRWFNIRPEMRVADYGCGTLRLGGHFIRYLNPDSYFGYEVVEEFLAMGKDLVGKELLDEKRPRFGLIGDEAAKKAGDEFGADFVFSSAVVFHVHPDEIATYFGNLLALTAKPGSVLVFDAHIAEQNLRYSHRGWAWPLQFFIDSLSGLEFVQTHKSNERKKKEADITSSLLEFRRPL